VSQTITEARYAQEAGSASGPPEKLTTFPRP
jgi:hypothetical protein